MEVIIENLATGFLTMLSGGAIVKVLDFFTKNRTQNLDEFKALIETFQEERDKQDLKAEKQDLKIENQGLKIDNLLEESAKSKRRIESLLAENIKLRKRIKGLEGKVKTIGLEVIDNHETDHNPEDV